MALKAWEDAVHHALLAQDDEVMPDIARGILSTRSVDLVEQVLAAVEAVDRQVGRQGGVGQERDAADPAPKYVTFINPQPSKGMAVFARIAVALNEHRPDISVLVVEGPRDVRRRGAAAARSLRADQPAPDGQHARPAISIESAPSPHDQQILNFMGGNFLGSLIIARRVKPIQQKSSLKIMCLICTYKGL